MNIIYPTQAINTPSIASGTIAINANAARRGFMIQNSGTATLYVLFGVGASTTVFHVALKACTANDDGSGGLHSQAEGVVYTGTVTVAGSPIRYVVTELAP